MKLAISFVFNLALVLAQSNSPDESDVAINKLFTTPNSNTNSWDKYVEVTTKSSGSLGAIEKCGEGSDEGRHLCVPYNQCDPKSKTIKLDGRVDGFGVINIRFGENTCGHYLDVCCGVPDSNQSQVKEPVLPDTGTTARPPVVVTQPPIDTTSDVSTPLNSYCGIRNPNGIDFKITGNSDNEAEYGEFPWMVALLNKNYNTASNQLLSTCGGSLITPVVVLTGAHCVFGKDPNNLKVRAGEWDTQTTKERLPYQERDISQIITHPDFNERTVLNDIALLILTRPFDKANNIGTICLPSQNQPINSQNCFATGWGKDVFGKEGKYQVILKKIELPIVKRPQCEEALRTTRLGKYFNLHKSFICAGGEKGKDTCTGDGGSPLVCPDPQNSQRYVQAGIVSWGIGCGESNIPGVYANVPLFRNWIDQQMERLNLDTKPYYL